MNWTDNTSLMVVGAVILAAIGLMVWWSRNRSAPKKEGLTLPVSPLGGVTAPDAPVLALFHATWCPACQAFLPVWKAISGTLGRGAVEFEHSTTPNMQEYGIAGFPTIRLYRSGCAPGRPYVEYNGPRTFEGVMSFFTSGGAGSPPQPAGRPQPIQQEEPQPTVEHFETRLPGNFGSNMVRGSIQSPPVAVRPRKPRRMVSEPPELEVIEQPPPRSRREGPRNVTFSEPPEIEEIPRPSEGEEGPTGFLPQSLPGSRYQTFAQLGELPPGVSV